MSHFFRLQGIKATVSGVFEDLKFKSFQTFWKLHCVTKSLFFELETPYFGYRSSRSFGEDPRSRGVIKSIPRGSRSEKKAGTSRIEGRGIPRAIPNQNSIIG